METGGTKRGSAKETMQLPEDSKRERGQKPCGGRRRNGLPENGRTERSRERDRKKRRRSLRRFFRGVRRRRTRKKRAVCLLLLSAAVIYLMMIGAYSELFLSVREILETQAVLEHSMETGDGSDLFHISIRLKNGEIVFYRERTKWEETGTREAERIDNNRP